MTDLPLETFMERLGKLDEVYDNRLTQARAEGKTLRYAAQVADSTCRVSLMAVSEQGRLAALRGPENVVVFHTGRYSETPLTITGPGAGPEVTAAGVLSDILSIVRKG